MQPRASSCVSFVLLVLAVSGASMRDERTLRASIRVLGLGPWCVGCPNHYCDDDPNVVLGYCCGCAPLYDFLPVTCSNTLRCPLNTYELCNRYEYMMYCCC